MPSDNVSSAVLLWKNEYIFHGLCVLVLLRLVVVVVEVMRQIDSFRTSRKFATTQTLEFCALRESDVRVKVTHEAA